MTTNPDTTARLAHDLWSALGDLSDSELAEQLAVYAGIRDALDVVGLRHASRVHGILAVMCAAEQRRRRREVKDLNTLFVEGEEVTAWWGPDAVS